MFIVALFTIAKTWNQSKCPLMGEWIKKELYLHTHTHTHTAIWGPEQGYLNLFKLI